MSTRVWLALTALVLSLALVTMSRPAFTQPAQQGDTSGDRTLTQHAKSAAGTHQRIRQIITPAGRWASAVTPARTPRGFRRRLALSQPPSHCAYEPYMRGRELGDKRTQLGFCRSSLHRRLGAAGDLDFNLAGTASRGFFLHAHDGFL